MNLEINYLIHGTVSYTMCTIISWGVAWIWMTW